MGQLSLQKFLDTLQAMCLIKLDKFLYKLGKHVNIIMGRTIIYIKNTSIDFELAIFAFK